jgi:recyclin-1
MLTLLEIMSAVLDYLPVPDLVRCAQLSRRYKEMVYDDTRWVQRLSAMGCWNDAEARRRVDPLVNLKFEAQTHLHGDPLRRTGTGLHGKPRRANGLDGQGESSTTIFDARWNQDQEQENETHYAEPSPRQGPVDDGFDATMLSSTTHSSTYHATTPSDALDVFKGVRSIRGQGRQQYGRIHGALGSFYVDAVTCQSPTDARVFRAYRDPNQQAQMLANLSRFSKSDLARTSHQEDKLAALMEAFQNAVSREFEQGIDAGDIEGKMRNYAHVLFSLNGGHRGVEIFISRSNIFNEKVQFGRPIACLNEAGASGISFEPSYRFFTGVSAAFNEHVAIIDQVFPSDVNVIGPLLEKLGKEVISEYLTTLFDETHQISVELYLKAVSATYVQSINFAKSLKPSRDSGDDFYETVDRILAEAFEPHIDLYLKEEVEFFKRKSDSEVGNWERQLSEQDASMQSMFMSNVNRQADKKDFLTSFKKVVMMPVNVLPNFPISSPFGGKSVTRTPANEEALDNPQLSVSQTPTRSSTPGIVNGTARSIHRSPTPVAEAPTTELAAKAAIMNSRLEGIRSLFSIEVALNLVHAAKSSIERATVFVKADDQFSDDARKQCELVFTLLLQSLGTRHIKAGFDQAVDHLSNYNPREASQHSVAGVAPLVTFLELVNVGDLIQQMLDVFYEQELVATGLTDRNDFLDPAVKEKKRFEQMLDERVAAGLNKGIEALVAEVDYVYATTQKPEDFNPPSNKSLGSGVIDIGPSEAAKQIVDVVSSHTKMLVGSTDKNMLDVFNQEVGLRLFASLCKHLKRQRISVNGSIKLIRYVTHSFLPLDSKSNAPPPN